MADIGLTGRDVAGVLAEAPGLTARELRVRLVGRGHSGLTRKDVNRVLYAGQRTGVFASSEEGTPRWRLASSPMVAAEERTDLATDSDSQENVDLLFEVLDERI